MKKKGSLWLGLPALVLAMGLSPFTPTVRAQSQDKQPSAQQQPGQQKSNAFVGQIVKAKNGQFALLVDKQTGSGFYLDDQASITSVLSKDSSNLFDVIQVVPGHVGGQFMDGYPSTFRMYSVCLPLLRAEASEQA